jgi:hypothetical protein
MFIGINNDRITFTLWNLTATISCLKKPLACAAAVRCWLTKANWS